MQRLTWALRRDVLRFVELEEYGRALQRLTWALRPELAICGMWLLLTLGQVYRDYSIVSIKILSSLMADGVEHTTVEREKDGVGLFRGYGEGIDPQQGVIYHARTNLRALRAAVRWCPEYCVYVHQT